MDKLSWDNRNRDRADNFLQTLYPNEQHSAGGDCPNPKCDYQLTPQDWAEAQQDKGWFVCPKCGTSSNLFQEVKPGGYTHAVNMTPTELGTIGELVIARMGTIPEVGQVIQHYGASLLLNPIDFHIGPYGVEVKTNHSESTPRFKLTGGGSRSRAEAIQTMIAFCSQQKLIPAMIGVRLNFYTNKADIFFRQGLADTWIGSSNLQHIATVDFTNLNPYKTPSEVPPPQDLPDESDSDIPF